MSTIGLRRPRPVYVSPPPPVFSPNWWWPGTGTAKDPYHSITTALQHAGDGGVLLFGGHYNEPVTVSGLSGHEGNRIVVQPLRGHRVTIDCFEEKFLVHTPAAHWRRVTDSPVEEYVWTEPIPPGESEEISRGAFLDTPRHTRLITYSQHGDLAATSQVARRPTSLPADNHVWTKPDDMPPVPTSPEEYRNWVYMGPGIWLNTEPEVTPHVDRFLHIRLSHTTTNATRPEWPEYRGATDPRLARLALSKALSSVLSLDDCHHLVFRNLTLRFGGRQTVLIRNCTDLEFDHVSIWAGARAIRFEAGKTEHNRDIVFHDGVIDGGLPTWLYRSDRKDNYWFVPTSQQPARPDDARRNDLADNTMSALISTRQNTDHVQIHHCDIRNGHDVCVFGTGMRYHHNWIHNINDDALFMGGSDAHTEDAWIYRNVITQVLTTFSFAADAPQKQVRLFRNLIDLRRPTLGIRPQGREDDDGRALRYGQFFKSNGTEGPIDFWHNTCLTLDAGRPEYNRAALNHYNNLAGAGLRRSFNNVFVGVYSDTEHAKPIAFVPPPDSKHRSNGNLYERVGPVPESVDRFIVDGAPGGFTDLADYQTPPPPEAPSLSEQDSDRADPQFASFGSASGTPDADDDLRLRAASPGAGRAVSMPPDINTVDDAVGFGGPQLRPRDRGCYDGRRIAGLPFDFMWVGVDGRSLFPRRAGPLAIAARLRRR